MRKIQIKLFDERRNQNFWFHFCYLSDELWEQYQGVFKSNNMDTQIKEFIKQDFGLSVANMADVNQAKDMIKSLYAESHPDIFLAGKGDRQGWTRVWLSSKIKRLLEEKNE